MMPRDSGTEAPLVVGDDTMGRPTVPRGDDPATSSGSQGPGTLRWLILGLGLVVVAVAIAGISLRPPASDTQLAPVAGPSASVPSDDVPADSVVTAAGPRQTVTVWTLPSGVSTWWPLGSHVVFMSVGQDQAEPRVFVHDKVSGRATWSTDVAAGQVVVVRDPDNGDSVRFTVPGAAGVAAGSGETGGSPSGVVDDRTKGTDTVLELSVLNGSVLASD